MKLSPQSKAVYQSLLDSDTPLSAKQLAAELNIHPATLYRLTEPLLVSGLITKTGKYPYGYSAKSIDDGLSLFLMHQNNWFSEEFVSANKKKEASKKPLDSQEIKLSFVQSRDELMRSAAEEIDKATKSIDLLRSGHEFSSDVLLSIIGASKRNIITRMLIQDYSAKNRDLVANWQKNGILVRKTTHRHVRLMLYDSSIIYFMSYKNTDSNKDLGMKINYPPFAAILAQLFEQWWEKAEVI